MGWYLGGWWGGWFVVVGDFWGLGWVFGCLGGGRVSWGFCWLVWGGGVFYGWGDCGVGGRGWGFCGDGGWLVDVLVWGGREWGLKVD